jgi:hypothetical protein
MRIRQKSFILADLLMVLRNGRLPRSRWPPILGTTVELKKHISVPFIFGS